MKCIECGANIGDETPFTVCDECWEHKERGSEMKKVEKMSGIAVCLDCGTPLAASATPHRWHCPKCSADEAVEKAAPDKPQCRTCPLWDDDPACEACHHTSRLRDQETGPCWFCEHHPDYPAWSVWELLRRKGEVQG